MSDRKDEKIRCDACPVMCYIADGKSGACDRYVPPSSPWCSGKFYLERQFPEMHTRSPAGLDLAAET